MEQVRLTPEVEATSQLLYVIRIDGENVGYSYSLDNCLSMIDSIAAHESKRMSSEWAKILREDLEEGKKVILLKQDVGRLYNGSPIPTMTIDFCKVPELNLIRHRFSEKIPPPPPPPSMEEIQKIANEKYDANIQENLPDPYYDPETTEDYSSEEDSEVGSSSESESSDEDYSDSENEEEYEGHEEMAFY